MKPGRSECAITASSTAVRWRPGPSAGATAAVVLNAAAAIYVAGKAPTYEEAVEHASTAVKEGLGIVALDRLRNASR